MSEIIIIAAMAENRVIGINNLIPWVLKEDMTRFRQLTNGWPCIMGRKTWDSLPKKPLPGRLNIVISRSAPNLELRPKDSQNVMVFPSLSAAIEYCDSYEKIFICGGETIYRQAIDLADKIELTLIHRQYEGDTFFPEIDTTCWTAASTVNFDTFSFITYIKNKKDIK